MTIYEAMPTRRTIRRFMQKPISDEVLEKAVNVARLAPVGGNVQSLKFCVVKTPELVSAVFDETKWGMHLKDGSGRPKPGELPSEQFVLFGVRACDAKSFDILDKVFLAEPADQFYQARRENGIVITTACGAPEETCFCKIFGIDAANPGGDISTWIVDGHLYWEPVTEKGKAFTEEIEDLFETADTAAVEAQKKEISGIMEQLPLTNLSLDGWNGDATKEKFDDPRWAELSEACLGCGACTFGCPTCQCYDVRDYDTGHGIQRFRCWDSCMYNDFTMMAHGTNRPTQLQRFRQRFMHKLVYFPANNDGEYSCVGCGRCVSKCPISMNIAKVIKAFGGDGK